MAREVDAANIILTWECSECHDIIETPITDYLYGPPICGGGEEGNCPAEGDDMGMSPTAVVHD